MQTSNKQNIAILWLFWHFIEMPKFLFGVWKNYILFALNYFSIPVLLKSLLAPWRRYRWNYPKGFDLAEFFSTLISNVFSRFLGMLMRIVLIIFGIFLQLFIIVVGFMVVLFWIFVPFIIIIGFLIFLFY